MQARMLIAAGLLCLGLTSNSTASGGETSYVAPFERAEALLPANLRGLVRNETVQPHWFADSKSFWYRRDTAEGAEYVIVDAATGTRRAAFDHDRMARAASQAVDQTIEPGQLLLTSISRQDGETRIHLVIDKQSVECTTAEAACTALPTPPPPSMDLLTAPSGDQATFTRDHNLWLRSLADGEERQLTFGGEPYFGWGNSADQYKLAALRSGMDFPVPPSATYWSPDSRWLITQRLDEREVLEYPFVESAPPGKGFRPRLYPVRIPLLGDPGDRVTLSHVIDVSSGKVTPIKLAEGFTLEYLGIGNAPLAWSPDGSLAYFLAVNAGARVAQLVEVTVESGDVRVVIEETSSSSVTVNHRPNWPNIHLMANGEELIWFSERDGWGHLYLYDLGSGKLKNRITDGDWLVFDIIRVDEARRQVVFAAGGREPGRNPYYRHLYRASLDGGDPVLLTPSDADHEFNGRPSPQFQAFMGGTGGSDPISPDGRFLVDRWSTVDNPPVTELRSIADGRLISRLEEADATGLYAAGWRPPKRFTVLAADGETELHGLMYLPPGFDACRRYPVIDAIYGGPISVTAPRSFKAAWDNGYLPASLAELGFVVFQLDGRGTPYRSLAFREAGFGSFADPQLEDHVAAIRQLGERHPWLDTDRVGIYGHSNGGYLSARALLKHPEVFKVGFASAGPHNFQGLPGTGAPWFGVPDYGDGAAVRPDVNAVPENYRVMDNAVFADRLQGRLMLVCGELDSAAFPALTMQLAAALIEANKSFDFLYLPGRTHRYFVDEMYVTHRLWDYFSEHLSGEVPRTNLGVGTRP